MMKELLEQHFFPYVIKPGRYAGGEPGQIIKEPLNRVKYLHAFPDKYELGQSYLGLQTLYHIINLDDRFLCERVFAPDNDAEQILLEKKLPLFSLESKRAAKDFDAIGFTLTYELVYTNTLNMLKLAGIPLLSSERTDDDPIIMAGGPAAYNPEPMADFIDLFFIGDGESGILEILSILHELKDASREEKLKAIAQKVESVYIPAFYDEDYQPKFDFVPEFVTARIEKELKPSYYPEQPLVPIVETVHQHLSVEIMRGCPQGCRFCQAGPIYRPIRLRPQQEIIDQATRQLEFTGNEELTLLSLSSSDYPDIDSLATTLARKLEKDKISISLPSLRPGSISPKLLKAVKKVRRAGLTISPEAATERLRSFIRKDFPDKAIYDTARLAFEQGWSTLKLYFMIGLPTETEEDLLAINEMVQNIYNMSRSFDGKHTINVTLSPFVPKPHTPFQWDEIVPPEVVLDKIKLIKNNNRINQVNFKYPICESSLLQGLLGRGGRAVGKVILDVYNDGARFDGWNEDFNYDRWKNSFEKNGIDINELIRPIPFSKPLPWRVVRKGVSVEHLKAERQKTSMQLREYLPKTDDIKIDTGDSSIEYGRSKKTVASKNVIAPTKNKVRFRWGKSEQFKYMGHQDNLRFIERLLRKSKLPVQYSQGFNPSMKLSFSPPLPLGFTSSAEYFEVTLTTNFMNYMGEKLRLAAPDGFNIIESQVIMSKSKSLSSLLNRVEYSIPLKYMEHVDNLDQKIAALLASSELIYERQGKKDTKAIDLRPAVHELKIDDDKLRLILGIGEGGYAKPGEVLALLLGDKFDEYLMHKFHREEMYRIDDNGNKIDAMDL